MDIESRCAIRKEVKTGDGQIRRNNGFFVGQMKNSRLLRQVYQNIKVVDTFKFNFNLKTRQSQQYGAMSQFEIEIEVEFEAE